MSIARDHRTLHIPGIDENSGQRAYNCEWQKIEHKHQTDLGRRGTHPK